MASLYKASTNSASAVDRREAMQKKTFTRWANSYLKKREIKIEDLYADVSDGVVLCNLCEIIGKDSIKATINKKFTKKPKMKIQKLENLNMVLEYFKAKEMTFTNIGSTDLMEGNGKLILGLIWKIILRFVIDEEGKNGLLLWCQRSTKEYDNIDIQNFTKSFSNGLAFCGLIHHYRPDLLDYDSLSAANPAENCELAFSVAQEHLGIDRLLDVEDVAGQIPDEKSVVAYVSALYQCFASLMQNEKHTKAIESALAITRKHKEMISNYNSTVADVNGFVNETTPKYADSEIPSSTAAIKDALLAYYQFRKEVQPEWETKAEGLPSLILTLNQSKANNNRPVFEPETAPSAVAEAMNNLHTVEKAYEEKLLKGYESMREADKLAYKANEKTAKIGNWVASSNEQLSEEPHVTSVQDADTLLDSHEIFKKQLDLYQQEQKDLEDLIAKVKEVAPTYDTAALESGAQKTAEDLNSLVGTGEAYREKVSALRDQMAEAHKADKLAFLAKDKASKIARWASSKDAEFKQAQAPSTLAEADNLLDGYNVFKKDLASKQEEQKECENLIAKAKGTHGSCDTSAAQAETEKAAKALSEAEASGVSFESDVKANKEKLERKREANNLVYLATDKASNVSSWCDQQQANFANEPVVSSLAECENLLDAHERFNEDLAANNKLQDEATQLVAMAKGVSQECDTSQADGATQASADALASVQSAGEAHKEKLNKLQDEQSKLKELGKQINVEGETLLFDIDQVDTTIGNVDSCEASDLKGFDEEVAKLDGLDDKISALKDSQQKLKGDLDTLENANTNVKVRNRVSDVLKDDSVLADLENKLSKKKETVKGLRDEEATKENLRKEFAAAADDAIKAIDALVGDVQGEAESGKSVEDKIEAIGALARKCREDPDLKAKMDKVESTGTEAVDAGILINPYTPETVDSVKSKFKSAGDNTQDMLDDLNGQLLATKDLEITPEQLQAVTEVFQSFDQDGDGLVNLQELKDGCQGLNLLLSDEEVEAEMAKRGTDNQMGIEQFTDFMLEQMKTGTSLEDVMKAWESLSKSKSHIAESSIDQFFKTGDTAEYLKNTMSKEDDGYEYPNYTQDMFSV